MNNNEQPRLFSLCAFALFTVRWANLYQPHVCQLIPKVWTHNWANFHYIRVAIYVNRWSFWFSICGNFVSWCRIRPALWPIALNSCLMIQYLLYLDGVYIWMEGATTVGLTVLTLHSFMDCSNQALWNIHTAVSPSGIDTEWEASQEFLPPLTQLITKCKRRTKITRKIKRSKQSHCYYPNSVATDRLVLAGWWRWNKFRSWWCKHELEGKSQCEISQSRRVV